MRFLCQNTDSPAGRRESDRVDARRIRFEIHSVIGDVRPVAPKPIVRERLGASRVRSLRSPLTRP